MANTQLKREDFSYTANSGGYMLMYKGQSIGGAGILPGANTPKGINATRQTQDYVNSAKIDIQNIVFGHPGRYGASIDRINKG